MQQLFFKRLQQHMLKHKVGTKCIRCARCSIVLH
jgi:hypothetical protein